MTASELAEAILKLPVADQEKAICFYYEDYFYDTYDINLIQIYDGKVEVMTKLARLRDDS